MGLFSWLFGRGRSRALAELPAPPAVPEPAPAPAGVEPEPALAGVGPEPAVVESEPVAAEPESEPVDETDTNGEISPARLDAALQRLRAEHPPAAEG